MITTFHRTWIFTLMLCVGAVAGTSDNVFAQTGGGDEGTGAAVDTGDDADATADTGDATADTGDATADTGDATADTGDATADTGATATPPAMSIEDAFRQAMEQAQKPFEFHGYLRSGFGFNHKGGDMEAFRPPTIFPHKWRLGNENETYGEAALVNNWTNPEKDGAWLKTQLLLAFVTGNNNNFDNTTLTIREAFAQAGGVLKSAPDVKFWAGQRFYRRHDIHVIDFYFFDTSGYGGGAEDIDLGFGKLALAFLGGSDDAIGSTGGRFAKLNLDARVYGIKLAGGEGTVWLSGSRHSELVADEGGDLGFSVGALYSKGGIMGGFNKASVQYGMGPGSIFNTYIGPLNSDTYQIRVTDQLQIQPSDKISMMAAGVFEIFDNGQGDFNRTWISAGLRPVYHMTKYMSLASELSFDYISIDTNDDGDADLSGPLMKFTVAPQISAGNSFWSRPVVRAFVTAAYWGEDLIGSVGENYYGDPANDAQFGMSFGVQAEAWW
jgi:maltoporin